MLSDARRGYDPLGGRLHSWPSAWPSRRALLYVGVAALCHKRSFGYPARCTARRRSRAVDHGSLWPISADTEREVASFRRGQPVIALHRGGCDRRSGERHVPAVENGIGDHGAISRLTSLLYWAAARSTSGRRQTLSKNSFFGP